MRKGEIYDVAGAGERPDRVLIVSNDDWNEGAPAQGVIIARGHGMTEILPFAVVLHEADSVSGVVFLDSLHPVNPDDVAEQIGSVGGPTLSKIDHCLRAVFAL